jgi:hypothetical protein
MALQQDVGGIAYPPALPTPEIDQPPVVPIRPTFTRVSAASSSQDPAPAKEVEEPTQQPARQPTPPAEEHPVETHDISPQPSSGSSDGVANIEDIAPEPKAKAKSKGKTKAKAKGGAKPNSFAQQTNPSILPYMDINNDPYFIKL